MRSSAGFTSSQPLIPLPVRLSLSVVDSLTGTGAARGALVAEIAGNETFFRSSRMSGGLAHIRHLNERWCLGNALDPFKSAYLHYPTRNDADRAVSIDG